MRYYVKTNHYSELPNLFPACDIDTVMWSGLGRDVRHCSVHGQWDIPSIAKRCLLWLPREHVPCDVIYDQVTICETHSEEVVGSETGKCSYYKPLPSPLKMLADCAE